MIISGFDWLPTENCIRYICRTRPSVGTPFLANFPSKRVFNLFSRAVPHAQSFRISRAGSPWETRRAIC